MGLDERVMPRLIAFALILGIAFAVLAFGGAEPATFALVQILLLGVAAWVLARDPKCLMNFASPLTFVVPAALTVVILLQLSPLPSGLAQRLTGRENSIPWANLHLSIEAFSTRTHALILLTCFVAFYFAQVVSKDPDRTLRLIVSLVALGTFEAFYGLIQYLGGWQKIFFYVKKFDMEEATGTYINRNHYAGFLEMILPFSLALLFLEYTRLRRAQSSPIEYTRRLMTRQTLQRLVLYLSIAVVLLAALLFSRSRMGIIAASVSSLVIFALVGISRFHGRIGTLLAILFISLSVSLAIWIGPGPIISRFADVQQEFDSRDQSRLSIWRDARELVRQNPVFGTGLGTFPIAYTTVQTSFLGGFVNHAHNDYLELGIDLGLPAALVLFGSIFYILARAVRTFFHSRALFERSVALGCAGSIVAISLHSLTDFNLYIPANAVLFSTILGLAVAVRPERSTVGGEFS
jgi:O-antigen ligase